MKTPSRRSTLALAILGLLCEGPMHPYRMQQLIKSRGKDKVINVRQRASIYQTIERLLRDGLIAVAETARDENRPERTVYALTELGRETVHDWLRAMLSTPGDEFPELPAALAYLPLLAPEDALRQLELREGALSAEFAQLEAGFAQFGSLIPRLFMIEDEYRKAMLATELEWVRSLIADLRSGRLTWSEEWIRQVAAQLEGPDSPLP